MTYFKLVLIGFQLLQAAIKYLEKQGIIKDEQRRELARQLQLAADAAGLKQKHKAEAVKLDEKQLDEALSTDFRD